MGDSNGTKKKGLGALKGFLLAILIVFLICVIGLLIRMVVAGDGDYLKPVKQIFGLEEEDDDEDEEEGKSSKKSGKEEKEETEETTKKKKASSKTSFTSAEKYTLLSDDVEDEDVKHYRLTVDMEDFFGEFMDKAEDTELPDEESGQIGSMIGMAMMVAEEMSDRIAGEMYFDVYFEGNEIVQIIIGYDYGEFLEKFYDSMLEDEDADELEIESVDELAEQVVSIFDEILDEDKLYDRIMEAYGDTAEPMLTQIGLKEKDIKDMIDFRNEEGLVEVYINGTSKLNALLTLVLGNEGLTESLKDMEKETKVKFDEDNIIESILKGANSSDIYDEFDFKFVEVK